MAARVLKGRAAHVLVAALAALGLVGCLSSTELDLKKARAHMAQKKPAEAVTLFARVADREANSRTSSEAALEAAKIYQYDLKKFDLAIKNYRIVIAKSPEADLRREAQSKVAGLLFYDIQDFPGAVIEYSRLLGLHHTVMEEIEWRSRIAKAYYYQGDYFQSKIEVERLLSIVVEADALYQTHLLKANILIGAKEHEEAAKVLELMIKKFPDRSQKDSIPLMLAVAFEEQRNFQKAIEVLDRVREYDPRKSFIEEKIRSLKERQGQQPGARGFRK